jgi:hypothetical protein
MATTTNITNAPKTVNGVPNSIYNNADFVEASADDKYLKKTGGVLSGSLTVPSLISNGSITLQSVYPSLPTQTQLGGVYKFTDRFDTTNNPVMRNTVFYSFGSLSLPAGCYAIFFTILVNNDVLATPRPTLTFGNIQGGFSLVANQLAFENRIMQVYNQSAGDGASISLQGSTFYQHNNQTNNTVYLNCFVGGGSHCSVTPIFTAVRIG